MAPGTALSFRESIRRRLCGRTADKAQAGSQGEKEGGEELHGGKRWVVWVGNVNGAAVDELVLRNQVVSFLITPTPFPQLSLTLNKGRGNCRLHRSTGELKAMSRLCLFHVSHQQSQRQHAAIPINHREMLVGFGLCNGREKKVVQVRPNLLQS